MAHRTPGMNCLTLAILVMAAFVSDAAYTQQLPAEDPFAEARIRLGAVAIDSRIGVRNVGIDTNVFNSATDAQSDFTATFSAGTKLWLRTGKGLATFDGDVDYAHFNDFTSERSVNGRGGVQYELRFNRLRPFASAHWLSTRQRPGYEIDARARHYENEFHGGVDLRVGSKGTVRLDYRRLDYWFAGDQ